MFTHLFIDIFTRGQASVKNSKGPPDFRFSNCHSPTQDLIALDFTVLPKEIVKGVIISYLFAALLHIGIIPKDN